MPRQRHPFKPRILPTTLTAVALSCGWSRPPADTVYKSLHAGGTVTYSSTPVRGAVSVETVALPAAPSEAERDEADAIQGLIEDAAARAEQEIQERRQAYRQALAAAQKNLDDARIGLEQARVIVEGDRWSLGQGGPYLKPSYFERLRHAEAAARQAEDELARVLRDAP